MRTIAKGILLSLLACAVAFGQAFERRATITGGGRDDAGTCTVEVVVDGSADVEIHGERALLRTVTGNPAEWRRFQCTSPMPPNPDEFRFQGIDGRGNQELVQDPRRGRGVAVIRIQDPRGGAERFKFDIEWRGAGSGFPSAGAPQRDLERGFRGGAGFASADAISACLLAVERRAQRDGLRNLRFGALRADDRPGRNDWIVGAARAQRSVGGRVYDFEFACSGDLDSGDIRTVELNPR